MGPLSKLLRDAAADAGRTTGRELRTVISRDPARISRRAHVDPHWRRHGDGAAARLAPDELIAPGRQIGRWRGVDPYRPYDGWQSVWKLVGLLGWAGIVAGAWWLGSSRGRGPLASVSELDRIGETLGAALDGFAELE
ncbi:MAG: hypothetical protein EA387_17175 [Nitriliruptor sp.]|nr:MAG: hypothetical protein EA387_17175 [Nitriliruptor sp.]